MVHIQQQIYTTPYHSNMCGHYPTISNHVIYQKFGYSRRIPSALVKHVSETSLHHYWARVLIIEYEPHEWHSPFFQSSCPDKLIWISSPVSFVEEDKGSNDVIFFSFSHISACPRKTSRIAQYQSANCTANDIFAKSRYLVFASPLYKTPTYLSLSRLQSCHA